MLLTFLAREESKAKTYLVSQKLKPSILSLLTEFMDFGKNVLKREASILDSFYSPTNEGRDQVLLQKVQGLVEFLSSM